MNKPIVRFERVDGDLPLPEYKTSGAAGMDLQAVHGEVLRPGVRALIRTGLKILLPEGWEAQVRSRSGLALKQGVIVLNAPGTVDADYRGEIGVILFNAGREMAIISPGDRIAQLVIAPAPQALIMAGTVGDDTDRGAGGFGSTGVK